MATFGSAMREDLAMEDRDKAAAYDRIAKALGYTYSWGQTDKVVAAVEYVALVAENEGLWPRDLS